MTGKEGGTGCNDAEIAALRAELRVARSDLAIERNLREAAEYQAGRLLAEIERLKGPPDQWQPLVEKFLADHPDESRHPSRVILMEAVGIPERDLASGIFRRLARVMRRIGGWQDRTDIPYHGDKVRGWMKPPYG